MRAKIQIGDYYSGMDLEDWIKQIDSRLEWLTSNLIEVEKTIEKINDLKLLYMKAEDYNPDFYKTLDGLQESTEKKNPMEN